MSERSNKMLQGCPHSVPIRIPCSECVEGRIVAGLNEVKRQHIEQDRSDYNDAMKSAKTATGQLEIAKIEYNKVVREKQELMKRINADWAEIKRLKEIVSDLGARMSAEAASRIIPKTQVDDDEATA